MGEGFEEAIRVEGSTAVGKIGYLFPQGFEGLAIVFFAVDEGFAVDGFVGQFAHVDEIDFVSPLSF